jgi:isocitrate/isopropylmalate dehydrogenase
VATFWTGAMMLEHLGGRATTKDVTRAVVEAIRGGNLPI